ncbi:YitT family protein [Actinomadura sp. LOL_016]|uniref:membrane protein YczE n=1 Tax=unclassified Actinomadura TaxID=2626254 RepID=UPI003A7FA616
MARRLVQLYVGLALYGLGLALQLSSSLGNDPWDVLHEGLALRFGLTIGLWILIAGALVMLAWIPLRQRPGVGTISNVLLVGAFTDLFLWLLPDPDALAARAAYLAAALLVGGFATGCYIGAGLGPGPRDGLMTGIAARGHSIRVVRTGIELTVLAVGWLLGGTVGIGTVLYAVAIGPLTHVFLPMLTIKDPARDGAPATDGPGEGAVVDAAGRPGPAGDQCSAASVASTAANSSGRTSAPFS